MPTIIDNITTYQDAMTYNGKKVDPEKYLQTKVDTKSIEDSLKLNKKAEKKGKTAADLIKVSYVVSKKTAGSVTFYPQVKIAKDAKKYLSTAEYKKLQAEMKAINKELKKNKCSFTINKRSVTDGTLVIKVQKTKKGVVKTNKKGKIAKVKSIKLKTKDETGNDITISLSSKDYSIELLDAASGLVKITGKKNFTGSITTYVQ